MDIRILYVLLALSVTMTVVATAYADDSDDTFDNEIGLFEEFLAEKRGRGQNRRLKAKWGGVRVCTSKEEYIFDTCYEECPGNPICVCLITPNGFVLAPGPCAQTNAQNIGI